MSAGDYMSLAMAAAISLGALSVSIAINLGALQIAKAIRELKPKDKSDKP